MTAMPPLETARLEIRPFAATDREAYQTAFGSVDPSYLQWAELNHAVLAGLRQPPYGDRAVALREGGALVGAVGLVPALAPFGQLPSFRGRLWTPEVGLYWAIGEAHRRRGYATEAARALVAFAFGTLRLARVVALTEAANSASLGVMRRLGMRIERNPRPDPPWFQVVGVLQNDGRD